VECLDPDDAFAFVEHTLGADRAREIEGHLAECATCRQLLLAAAPASEGSGGLEPERIGRYEIVELIGRGGMGAVYRARDPQLGREVALKLVRFADRHDAAARERLVGEARALAKLAHPNVVAVFDAGEDGADGVFVAMELIEGQTLRAWLDGARTLRAICEAFHGAGLGLRAAHAAGLVHRDFKPDNVIVGDDGRVRVVDFGLARDAGERGTDGSSGTPAYMSPEQLRGEPPTTRSDQYSFCIALREAVRDATPGRRIETAIARGLAHDPADRFDELTPMLDALVPRPRRLAIGAGIGATAALAGALGVWSWTRAPDACAEARAAVVATWSDEARREVERSIADPRRAKALVAAYDRHATRWRHARDAACEHPDADRETCLDALLPDFATAIAGRRRPADEPIARCELAAPLRARVAAVRERLVALQVAWLAGNPAPTDLAALATEARTLGYAPLDAELGLAAGELAATDRDHAGAVTALRAALPAAERAGDDPQTATIALALARSLLATHQLEPATAAIDRAASAIARAGDDPAIAADLAYTRGLRALARAQPGEATTLLEEARVLYGGEGRVPAGVALALERAYTAAGRPDDATRAFEAYLASIRDAAPALDAELVEAVATCARGATDLVRVERTCEAALARLSAAPSPPRWRAAVHTMLGAIAEARQDAAAAQVHYLGAVAGYEGGVDRELAESLESVGHQAYELGDHATAIAYLRRSVDVAARLGAPGETQLAFARGGLGRALVAAGELAEGLAELEWARPRLESLSPPRRQVVAGIRLAIADGMWRRNRRDDRARARIVAATALDDARAHADQLSPSMPDYVRAAAARTIARVEAWISAHRGR